METPAPVLIRLFGRLVLLLLLFVSLVLLAGRYQIQREPTVRNLITDEPIITRQYR